jgi:hypothetical protein
MAMLTAACVLGVVGVAVVRIAPGTGGPRTAAVAGLAFALAAAAVWAWQGPFARGWARRAGTPEAVLTAFGATGAQRDPLYRRFNATLRGPVHTGAAANGSTVVDAPLRLVGGTQGALRLRLAGTPAAGGGLAVDRSAVALGPVSDPGRYQGKLRSIDGGDMVALVGAADGSVLRLHMRVRFDATAASGTLTATPEAG